MKNISYVGKNEFGSFYDILTDDELMICVSTCEISVINGIKNPVLSDLILSYAKNIFWKKYNSWNWIFYKNWYVRF